MQRASLSIVLVIIGATCAFTRAVADEALGLYVGAGFGESHLRTEKYILGDTDYDYLLEGHHSAWYAAAGIRPFQPLGLELQYIDFGNLNAGLRVPIGQGGLTGIAAKAGTLSALGYLPLPVPFLDVYTRLGVARLHTTTTEVGPTPYLCPEFEGGCSAPVSDISDWSTNLAYGAGVQGKIGPLAIRAEYERIAASAESPIIASLGVMWTF
jgi:opacity protein-like surface antigen